MNHEWQLFVTTENYDYGGVDFYHWCKWCGSMKKVPGRVDKQTIFYLPGRKSIPNCEECVGDINE
jgi:hypothetical protein